MSFADELFDDPTSILDEPSRNDEPERDQCSRDQPRGDRCSHDRYDYDCRGEVIVHREVTNPETAETDTNVFFETCDRKGCPTCGPRLRRCHAAHYREQLERRMETATEEERLRFCTMTLPGSAGGPFDEMLRDLQSKRALFLQRMRDQSRNATYMWVVETGDSGRPHLHVLLVSDLSMAEIERHWHGSDGGQINRVSTVTDRSELVTKAWYVTKEQFADPDEGVAGFPGYKTIGHSRDVLAYSDTEAKRKRAEHARADVQQELLSGNAEGRPLCDRIAYVAALEKALPNSIGDEVKLLGECGNSDNGDDPDEIIARLVRWSPEEALVTIDGVLRHMDPFAVAPAEMPVPQIFERTVPEGRHFPDQTAEDDGADAVSEESSADNPEGEATAPGEIGRAEAKRRDLSGLASVFEVETSNGEIERSVRWKGPVEPGSDVDLSPASPAPLCYSRVLQDLLRPDQKYWANRRGDGDRSARNNRGKTGKYADHEEWSLMLTDITVILDRSGSMSHIRESTIEDFNQFLSDQREEDGEAEITLIQFNNEAEELWSGRSLEEAFELDEGHYVTSGGTALNDAVGKGIQEAKARKARKDDGRELLFVVITDGKERDSTEFSRSDIQSMIEVERDEGRKFIFLAANQNAMATADSYGMDPDKSLTYAHNDEGNAKAYNSTSRVVSQARNGTMETASFTADEREEQKEAAAEHDLAGKALGADALNLNGTNDKIGGPVAELTEKKHMPGPRTENTRNRRGEVCPSWDKHLRGSSCNEKSTHFVRRDRARGSPTLRVANCRVRCRSPTGGATIEGGSDERLPTTATWSELAYHKRNYDTPVCLTDRHRISSGQTLKIRDRRSPGRR